MEFPRYLECLDADYRRLRGVVADHLEEPVPSCPGWTGDRLVRHVAGVYLHKECMRRNASPRPWPPEESGEPTLALLDRAYAELAAEFAARAPGSPSVTWCPVSPGTTRTRRWASGSAGWHRRR